MNSTCCKTPAVCGGAGPSMTQLLPDLILRSNWRPAPARGWILTQSYSSFWTPTPSLEHNSRRFLPNAKPVRVVVFDKTPQQNWGVPWHQDRVIAVKARHDVPGYHNWSQKCGVWHCEAPSAVLGQMLFLRLHLDPTDAGNGAMEIALGSHRAGAVAAG